MLEVLLGFPFLYIWTLSYSLESGMVLGYPVDLCAGKDRLPNGQASVLLLPECMV